MPSHMHYETHSFSKTALFIFFYFIYLFMYLKFKLILSQNPMHFSISIGKSNAFISCLLICSMKLTPFRKQLLIFWPIFFDLTFYRKIQCVSAFLSQNTMRSFHAFPYIAKSNAFIHFHRYTKCVTHFKTNPNVFLQ